MLEAWARGSSEGQRQESTLKLKPMGFVDGLDVVGERGRNQVRSRAWGLSSWRKGGGTGRQAWVGEQISV